MENPPLDFLLVCSGMSLRDFELGRLNQIANIRKQLHAIEDQLRQVQAEAELARWLLEHREELLAAGAARGIALQHSFEFVSHAVPAEPACLDEGSAAPLAVRPARKALRA